MKLKYKNVLFDIDGTIVDSEPGIVACADYTLKSLNCENYELKDLKKFLGMVLFEAFRDITNLPEDLSKEAVSIFRSKYSDSGLFQCLFYDGIVNLIKELHSLGATLCIASSKPKVFSERLLLHYGLKKYFTVISGVDVGDISTPKSEVVRRAIIHPDSCVLIGDRKYDTIGARANNIASIGVTYGYACENEHETYPPDYLANTIFEVKDFLIID